MVRAPVSHTGGHWFESSIAHHTRFGIRADEDRVVICADEEISS